MELSNEYKRHILDFLFNNMVLGLFKSDFIHGNFEAEDTPRSGCSMVFELELTPRATFTHLAFYYCCQLNKFNKVLLNNQSPSVVYIKSFIPSYTLQEHC